MRQHLTDVGRVANPVDCCQSSPAALPMSHSTTSRCPVEEQKIVSASRSSTYLTHRRSMDHGTESSRGLFHPQTVCTPGACPHSVQMPQTRKPTSGQPHASRVLSTSLLSASTPPISKAVQFCSCSCHSPWSLQWLLPCCTILEVSPKTSTQITQTIQDTRGASAPHKTSGPFRHNPEIHL